MNTQRSPWYQKQRVLFGGALLASTLLLVSQHPAAPAQAVDLPTWEDVEAAKQNEAATAKKVTQIEKLLAAGEKKLEQLRGQYATAAEEMLQAEEALESAAFAAEDLATRTEESRAEADEAATAAGAIVSEIYRSGGVDRSLEFFLEEDTSTSDALLDRLGMMSQATERSTRIFEKAEETANTTDSLAKRAEVARQERERIRGEKDAKEQAAAEAVATQSDAVQAQESQQRELASQLAALKDSTAQTVAGYEERLRVEEEQRRQEAERLAREARERERSGGGGGPTAPPPGGGGSTGWVVPTSNYWISGYFGGDGVYGGMHTGLDFAANCGVPVVAASSGTVSVAGWVDNMGGNMVYLNQDNGYQTRYAHLNSWPPVSNGQYVSAGQVIGWVGTTGASTGCHLHFEARASQDNGWYGFVDPYPLVFG